MSIRIRDIDMRFLSHDLSDHFINAGIVSKGLYILFQPKCRLGFKYLQHFENSDSKTANAA